jgi:hypothetical protein
MSTFQSKTPRIYADRLMPLVMKAMKEYYAMEDKEETLAVKQYLTDQEYDEKMRGLQDMLRSVHEDLRTDTIKGDTGLERIEAFFNLHHDLTDALIETGNFPELRGLNEIL